MDHHTQQIDDNNPKSEANPDVSPDANLDSGQETPPPEAASQESPKAASTEPFSSMSDEERKAALEVIIYAADEPATIEQLATALGEPKALVQAALDELVASYASDSRGIEIRGVAGGYKMYTKPQHHDLVRRFIKSLRPPLRLTMPALETLAVISYKQPVTAPEIQEIRGVNTSGVIKTLLDKKLITTAGRKEVIGRPILYRTSKEFLMRFGLSDLGELPSLKEFEALAREALGTDEGVADSDAGDESVLDSLEPTEAEAAAELEASASEDAVHGTDAMPSADEADSAPAQESPAPKQFEQCISSDLADVIASQPVEAAATLESEAEPTEATAAASERPVEPAGAMAEAHQAPDLGELRESKAVQTDAVDLQPSEAQLPEPEPASPQSKSAPPVFAEEPTHAVGSTESPDGPESSAVYESSPEQELAEREISDEILAQLTQGIEIEVSADSFAALSSTEVPAEESPTRFYSSDAEPEPQPPPAPEATETGTEHAATQESESTEPEKSRKAAAGE
ncbi:MAG TPA: SMC-Scp complex subunit ScpB [Candidatus Sulfotelmatobacter sp.]|nr:SMC-Scp complex subunit ScpB [Candidatus Sulfotelmatobacter sp.]